MREPIEPVDEEVDYRGVVYNLQGDYVDAQKTCGNFVFRCKFGSGVAGDPDTARQTVQRVIDANLGPVTS